MSWFAVRVRPHPARREAMVAALLDLGSGGVQEDGEALLTCVPASVGEDILRERVLDVDPGAAPEISPLPDTDWTEAWKRGLPAQELGWIAVVPPWLAEGRDPARTVVIDPGMAFGTGDHQTTRGVLRLLPLTLRAGDRVADLGTGSAVLAIAAAKFGAVRAVGIELDPDAIGNANENVVANNVASRVTIIEGDASILLPLLAPVDCVLANIISSVLIQMLPVISASLAADGRAILSGVLVAEREMMLRAFDGGGWQILDEDIEGEWWSVSLQRR